MYPQGRDPPFQACDVLLNLPDLRFLAHQNPPFQVSETNPNTGSTPPAWILASGSIRTYPASWGRIRKIGIGQSWEASFGGCGKGIQWVT